VTQVVEPDSFAPGPFQGNLQPLSDGGGISGGAALERGWEHPFGVRSFPVFSEDGQDRRGEHDASVSRPGFGQRDHQFPSYSVNLPLHPEFPGAEIEVILLEGTDLTPA
jgi:hypothetical protein